MDCLVLIPDRDLVQFDAEKKNTRIQTYSALFQSLIGIQASHLIHDSLFLFICVYYNYTRGSQSFLQKQLPFKEKRLQWLVHCKVSITRVTLNVQKIKKK
jgi:hypothetical protein